MREIKFRAWDGKIMYKFDLKDLYNEGCEANLMLGEPHLSQNTVMPYDGMPVMQFTGLLDKNGKEIYEGDLIKAKNYNYQHTDKIVYQIGYSTTSMMFCLEEKVDKDAIRCNVIHGFHSLEIIGNIFENPELLTPSESK